MEKGAKEGGTRELVAGEHPPLQPSRRAGEDREFLRQHPARPKTRLT